MYVFTLGFFVLFTYTDVVRKIIYLMCVEIPVVFWMVVRKALVLFYISIYRYEFFTITIGV